MILGRGEVQTDEAIIAEYRQFIDEHHSHLHEDVRKRYKRASRVMQRQLDKPLQEWVERDILIFYAEQDKTRRSQYCAFLSYLYFRGYVRPTFRLVVEYPGCFASDHKVALLPYRHKLDQTFDELGYVRSRWSRTGAELGLLISLLLIRQKTLDEVTREDFEVFREQYQTWYRREQRQKGGKGNSRVSRLERCLVHWKVLSPVKKVYRHEERFEALKSQPVRAAMQFYLTWCEVRYAPNSVVCIRKALLDFFLWLQETYPHYERLDDVSRPVALAYMKHLLELRDRVQRSLNYCNDTYAFVRRFFEFAIQEQVETSPHRNPFGMKDIPSEPKHVRRYLADDEVRKVLIYCENGASLRERTVVTVLLHTGIRASELAKLKTSDIVEIQGKWKLHIHEGKGLKDRLIPLTPHCLTALQVWQEQGWTGTSDRLFTVHNRLNKPWQGYNVGAIVHHIGKKLDIEGLCPHRFRHTFAVSLLNYGMRETALQKLLGHTTMNMTLQYARILDETVERAFETAVERMQEGPLQWLPSFLATDDYASLIEADALHWIRLPLGYCRRHIRLHCESDIKCLLCDRFAASPQDLPRLRAMHERFRNLGLTAKAEAVAAQIYRLEAHVETGFVPAPCPSVSVNALPDQTILEQV